MPTVPRRDPASTVDLKAHPNVQFSDAGATEETFGGGASGKAVGAASSGLFNTGLKLMAQQRKSADDTVVQDADTRMAAYQTDIELKIGQMRGKNSGNSMNILVDDWKSATEEIESTLSNDYQRAKFRSKNNKRFISSQELTKRHTFTETTAYKAAVVKDGIVADRNEAVRKYQFPKIVEDKLNSIEDRLFEEAIDLGIDPATDPQYGAKLDKEVGAAVVDVYSQYMLNADLKTKAGITMKAIGQALKENYADYLTKDNIDAIKLIDTKLVERVEETRKQAVKDQQQVSNSEMIKRAVELVDSPEETEIMLSRMMGKEEKPGGIDAETASMIINYVSNRNVKLDIAATKKLLAGVPEKYFNLDKDGDDVVDADVRYQEIFEFREMLLSSEKFSGLTNKQVRSKLSMTEKAFANGIKEPATESHKNGQTIWRYLKNWSINNMDRSRINAFEISVGGGEKTVVPVAESEEAEMLAYTGGALMKYMQKNDIKNEDITKITNMVLTKWLVKKYPDLTGKTELPTFIADSEASFKNIFAGRRNQKADVTIDSSPKPVYDPLTESLFYNKVTGEYKIIPK